MRSAILRTLAYQASWQYTPTVLELQKFLDYKQDVSKIDNQTFQQVLQELNQEGIIVIEQGRVALSEYRNQIFNGKKKELFFWQKLIKAKKVAFYLKLIPSIESVFLCNTMSLGQVRENSDIDFFIITKPNHIWISRFFSALPFKLLKLRPGDKKNQSPICLSFFISSDFLDFRKWQLTDDDPYVRYWFLSLLPLFDRGGISKLWTANKWILERHISAIPWISFLNDENSNQEKQTEYSIGISWIESFFKKIQIKKMPQHIKDIAQENNTNILINDKILKFHVIDRRQEIKDKYYEICKKYNIEA